MEIKVCNKCHEEKPLTEFYSDKSRKDGLMTKCKICDGLRKRKPKWNVEISRKKEKKRKETGYYKTKRENNPIFRIKKAMRDRLYHALVTKKTRKTEDVLGCSVEELKTYLENKFLTGMTWDNHGEWHIDHIIPLSSATSENEIYELSHYTNLQPLWAKDNLKKSNKIF